MSTLVVPSRPPVTDPTPLFEIYRGQFATSLLVAAVADFDLFGQLAAGPLTIEQLAGRTSLADRPLQVLLTALRAMGTLERLPDGCHQLTALAAEHLVSGGVFLSATISRSRGIRRKCGSWWRDCDPTGRKERMTPGRDSSFGKD